MTLAAIMIAVLFVRPDSVYKTLEGCDCYDAERDRKRRWPRSWGRLRVLFTHLETGKRWPSMRTLMALCRVFRCTPNQLTWDAAIPAAPTCPTCERIRATLGSNIQDKGPRHETP